MSSLSLRAPTPPSQPHSSLFSSPSHAPTQSQTPTQLTLSFAAVFNSTTNSCPSHLLFVIGGSGPRPTSFRGKTLQFIFEQEDLCPTPAPKGSGTGISTARGLPPHLQLCRSPSPTLSLSNYSPVSPPLPPPTNLPITLLHLLLLHPFRTNPNLFPNLLSQPPTLPSIIIHVYFFLSPSLRS